MTQLFTALDYTRLSSIVFQPDYPGYKPDVVEAPNGDGKLDTEKRYAHVSEKYLAQYEHGYYELDRERKSSILSSYLDKAHDLSLEIAVTLGVPKPFWPVRKYGALRVLEYDGKATTAPHTDFDLFTLMCYRNDEQYFKYIDRPATTIRESELVYRSANKLKQAQALNAQIHFGEIYEELMPNNIVANKHEVVASGGPWQYSVVYFSIPDWESVLPSGLTMGAWLDERIKRSRYDKAGL
jgi:hypothetical protein